MIFRVFSKTLFLFVSIECRNVSHQLLITASFYSTLGKETPILFFCESIPFFKVHLLQFLAWLELLYLVWLCKSVMWAYFQAYIATIKAFFHLFTDIFGQITPVFYRQVWQTPVCIKILFIQCSGRAGFNTLSACSAIAFLCWCVVGEFYINKQLSNEKVRSHSYIYDVIGRSHFSTR